MAGVFGVTPMQPYPSWAQGLEQGTGALANALYQRRMLDLERQKFGLQQAEAGYQPAHQEQVYTPGRLAQPSMVSVGNVPSPMPGTSTMGASSNGTVMGSPDAMARTTGSYKTTTVPGYYDITKSLPYAQAELNGRYMAALIGGQNRTQDQLTRYGFTDANNVYHPGSEFFLRTGVQDDRNRGQINAINARGDQARQTDQFLYGAPGTDANGNPVGARTMSTLTTQAPVLDERRQAAAAALAARQAAQSDLAAHRRATENAAAVRAAQQAVDADTRSVPKPPAFGFLNPSDSVAFYNRRAAAQARLTTDQSRLDSLNNAPTGLVTTPGARPFSSGSSVAPHVPRSGTEASNLTPTLRPMGSVAPTVTLGTRQVANQSTSTRPTATNLPRSPGDPTVSAGQGSGAGSERALYDAAVRRIAQNVSDPAEQARQFQQAAAIYQQRVARQKAPR